MISENDIRKYAGLMEELNLTGLEITEDNKVVRLEKAVPSQTVKEVITVGGNTPNTKEEPREEKKDYVSIKSPMVGVFYSSPAENAEPYVNVGDRVEKGKTLCIVEAMKLLNEIPSDTDGVISEICVADGQNVEYGTELFRITR